MKKFIGFALVAVMSTATLESCTSTSATSTASSIGTNLLKNIGTSLMQLLGNIPGLQGVLGNANMTSSLNSILTNPTAVSSFKNLLSSKYQIPMAKVNSAYSSFGNLQDVANFVSKNGNSTVINSLK